MTAQVTATDPLSAHSAARFRLEQARQQFLRELERWLFSSTTMKLPLDDIKPEQERLGRKAQRLLLPAHVEARGVGDVGPAVVGMAAEGDSMSRLGERRETERHQTTIFGEITVNRLAYSHRGVPSIHPLDEDLSLPKGLVLLRDPAPRRKGSATGSVRRSGRACRGIHGGDDSETQRREDRQGSLGRLRQLLQAAPSPTENPAHGVPRRRRCGGLRRDPDGQAAARRASGATRQRKKTNERRLATVAAVFTTQPRIRTPEDVVESLFLPKRRAKKRKSPRPEKKRVSASLRESKDAVIDEVAQEMHRRDPKAKKKNVVVTDGERAYRILCGEVSQVVEGMRQTATKRRLRGEKRETLLGVAPYFYRNRTRMRYHEYLVSGLPIASGAVEGACKISARTVWSDPGCAGKEDSATAMLKLRATYLSDDFAQCWEFHVEQDQHRLHPADAWKPASGAVAK